MRQICERVVIRPVEVDPAAAGVPFGRPGFRGSRSSSPTVLGTA